MQLQFDKTQIQCLQQVVREVQSQELTQEIRLTDTMPDVGRVVASWGQPIIRAKEWRSGGMQVSGGVMAWTLYLPEDGSQVQCVESWLPFQMKWEFPQVERDGTICVMPLLQSMDARCLSSRKIMVRAGISLLGEAAIPCQAEVCSPGEMPQDVQVLMQTYPMQIPKEAGERPFSLDTDISLPSSAPALEKILGYDLRFELRETKTVGDKLVFRGVATVHLRYLGTDGQIHTWDLEVPFSQYAELDTDHEENARIKMCFAVTGAELEQGAEENLTLKANAIGQYTVYDRHMVQIAADAYSPQRKIDLQTGVLALPAVLSTDTQSIAVEKTMQTDCVHCADVMFYPDHPRLYREDGKVYAQLTGIVQVLGYDPEGLLCSGISRWDADWEMELPLEVGADAILQPAVVTTQVGADSVNIQGKMLMDITTSRESDILMLTGLETGEEIAPDPDRPSVILRRCGDKTLWELAKILGSTVEAIRTANDLRTEPDPGQMLLIPIL